MYCLYLTKTVIVILILDSCSSQELPAINYNCGRLTQNKRTEFTKILYFNNTDIFILIEANKRRDSLENYSLPG